MSERPDLLVAEAARVQQARSLLARIDAFTKRTGITISAPFCNLSGQWEVRSPDGTLAFDNGFRMMDELERRYPSE